MIASLFSKNFISLPALSLILILGPVAHAQGVCPDAVSKKDLKLSGKALIQEYLKQETHGSLTSGDGWLKSAESCPEPVSEDDRASTPIYVIDREPMVSYRFVNDSVIVAEVNYDSIGAIEAADSVEAKSLRTVNLPHPDKETVIAMKTKWGWKLDRGTAAFHVLVSVVKAKFGPFDKEAARIFELKTK